MTRLTVLYDPTCPLCQRAQAWLAREPAYVELELLAADWQTLPERLRWLPQVGRELVVVADDGRFWIGPSAFVMCLWALRRWRAWSMRLAHPLLAPIARRFFRTVSARRRLLGAWLGHGRCAAGQCGAAYR